MKDALIAEFVGFAGHGSDVIEGYLARPISDAPVPSMVLVHHAPGLDPWCKEVVRRFATEGYACLAPHLYHRRGPGNWADVAAAGRAEGLAKSMPNDQVMGDIAGAAAYLRAQPGSNGKVGVIGFCSGGRQTFLAACEVPELDAAVDCWGGSILPQPESEGRPASRGVLHRAGDMSMPLLGIFGNDDSNPDRAEVDEIDRVLTELGKEHTFHRYDGAGHAFFVTDKPVYRLEQALDGWQQVFRFLDRTLKGVD
ncbi:MAG: dienelactone hydrolase family protein [Ilumatobacteraceae bacterium]